MMVRYAIHPDNPQGRLINQVAARLLEGAIMVYPTDTTYALGCILGNKAGMERIRLIRGLDEGHDFSLICSDLSSLSKYAEVDNRVFRSLKHHIPGPYTFILPATKAVPKAFMLSKKSTIGLRVPQSPILSALLEETQGQPLVSVTLQLAGQELPMSEPDEIEARLAKVVDLFVDSGAGGVIPSSVIDLTGETPRIIRDGLGDVSAFQA